MGQTNTTVRTRRGTQIGTFRKAGNQTPEKQCAVKTVPCICFRTLNVTLDMSASCKALTVTRESLVILSRSVFLLQVRYVIS